MKYNNENQIMDFLGIKSWKNLSDGSISRFSKIMPYMDKDVMIRIIDKFPEFTKFAMATLDSMEKSYNITISANIQSQSYVHNAYKDIRSILKDELRQDNLTSEQKKQIMLLIVNTGDKEFHKDSENKKFLSNLLNTKLITGALLSVIMILIGGSFLIGKGNEND